MSDAKDKSKQPEVAGEIPQGQVQHPETAYDRTDLSARGIVIFMVGLALTIMFIHLITWGLLRYFSTHQLVVPPRNAAIVTPAGQTGPRGDPMLRFPSPRLQPDPVADLNKFRAGEEQQLNSYGWVSQEDGVAHIPIEQAIDILSRQGLPVQPPPVLPPKADFGSGNGSAAGAAGGTEPLGNK